MPELVWGKVLLWKSALNGQGSKGKQLHWGNIFKCQWGHWPLFLVGESVATLALGSQPRQGVARLRAKWETQEHSTCSWECKECEGMNPHTPKWTPMLRVGVPKGLPNHQSMIAGVKTPCLKEFFISLESYWSVDVWKGLALLIWTFKT
jgi:hypothetical protein